MSYAVIEDGRRLTLQDGKYAGLYAGNDAQKPSSPAVGAMYYAVDTGRTYMCFEKGVWIILSSSTKERYSNHLGAVDNFTETGVTGSGSANTDATNHKMALSTGLSPGTSRFNTKKTWALSAKPLIVNFIINDLVQQFGGKILFGLKSAWTDADRLNGVFVYQDGGIFEVDTCDGTGYQSSQTQAVSSGTFTIVATSTSITWFKNGVQLGSTHTTHIPTGNLSLGACVQNPNLGEAASTISIDMMDIEVFG